MKPMILHLSGKDAPGITQQVLGGLSSHRGKLLDLGQSVLNGYLNLNLLFEIPPEEIAGFEALIERALGRLGLKWELLAAAPAPPPSDRKPDRKQERRHSVVTALGNPISSDGLARLTRFLADRGFNIESIRKLSDAALRCVELGLSSSETPDRSSLQKDFFALSQAAGLDLSFQEEGPFRRMKRVVVFDMDSTLIENEVIDELARLNGAFEPVAKITEAAMNGEIDFRQSLSGRVALLKGLKEKQVEEVYQSLKLTEGAEALIRTLKKLGYKIAVISGGFDCITERFRKRLGLDYAFSNSLEFKAGICTGNLHPPIIDAQRKADLLEIIARTERIDLAQTIAIGDGSNDVPMLARAGLGVAFNAKTSVREKVRSALNERNLLNVLFLLGLSEDEIRQISV